MNEPQKLEHAIYQSYGASMAIILAIGTIGNGLATCVLLRVGSVIVIAIAIKVFLVSGFFSST